MSFMRRASLAALCSLMFAAAVPAAAQVPTAPAPSSVPADSIREVRLRDGSILYGKVVEETPERVVIVTASGTRTAPSSKAIHATS